jgi:MFS family permease
MFAHGVPGLMREFHNTSSELGAFVLSIYVLGFAFGPIFLAPLSKINGRQRIYYVGNSLFVAFSIACALSKILNVLIIMRLLGTCWYLSVFKHTSKHFYNSRCKRLATTTIIRLVAGAVLLLAGQKLYRTLGPGWGNSLLALIAFILVPIPWMLLVWGERLRKRFTIRNL